MEKQEMMEMMEQFLARIDANTKTMLASMDAHQAEMDAMHEKTRERMDANSKAWREEIRAETEAIRTRTEAMREERMKASKEMKPEVAHQEVPREDASVMPVGETRKRRRDQGRNLAAVRHQKKQERNLDAGRRGKRRNLVAARRGTTSRLQMARRNILLTKETRGFCGSQKRVIVVYRKMPRHATVAWRKRHIRSTVERATQRVGRLRKNLQSRKKAARQQRI
jgi:hypothetical protein